MWERSLSSGVYIFGFLGDNVTPFHHSLKVHKLLLVSITCFDFLSGVRICNSEKTTKGLEESVRPRKFQFSEKWQNRNFGKNPKFF